jgi:hypothetical protein
MSTSNTKDGYPPTFTVSLYPEGDPDSEFNADRKNNPLQPYQRREILQRKDAFNIQCTAIDVIHGKLDSNSNSLATLIVLKFWFDKRHLGRRIASADIRLEFSGMDPEGERPEVHAITPHDKATLVETTTHQEDTVEGMLHGGVAGHGADVGGSYTWKRVISQDTSDATTISGSIDLEGHLWGEPNCASWTLLENETRKSGVPSTIQLAVVLKRENLEPFQCTVGVRARADKKTALEWLFGAKSNDDPVLFNPEFPPTNKLREYDTTNLGAIIREPIWEAGLIG